MLIAAAAASVNKIDWKVRSGMRRKDLPLTFPAILGRDVSGGVVRAVGANVKHFKVGEARSCRLPSRRMSNWWPWRIRTSLICRMAWTWWTRRRSR